MYSKLYKSIFDGSLYGQFEALTTFMAMLALADRHGEVDAAPAKIAGCLGCDISLVQEGIKQLEAPDPYSRTPLEDGKRLIPLKDDIGNDRVFGWKIVNYEKYRSIRNEEERRAYKREWDRKNRSKKTNPTKSDRDRPETTYTEAKAEADPLDQNTLVETKVSTCPIQKIIDLYHEKLPELPKVKKRTKTRDGYIKQRWREDLPKLDNWDNFFTHVRQSKFLMGKTQGSNGKPPFIADLEWLTKPANFAKIAEGKYVR